VFLVDGFKSKINANANNVIKLNGKGYLHGKALLDSGTGNEQYKKKLSKIQTMTTDCEAQGSRLIQLSGVPRNHGLVSGRSPEAFLLPVPGARGRLPLRCARDLRPLAAIPLDALHRKYS
jgi:hypothetical protein